MLLNSMSDGQTFTPPGQPEPAAVMYQITVTTDTVKVVGIASHG